MRLEHIVLTNFRTYKKATFRFPDDTTVILGPNAVGKTNILEAISLLTSGKSFRATKDSDMILWDQDVSTVLCEVVSEVDLANQSQECTKTMLKVQLTRGVVSGVKTHAKRYFVNDIPRRLIDFTAVCTSVLFSPSDLSMLTLSPGVRREYINSVLCATDSEYRRVLVSYERGLRQRNALLDALSQGQASRSQLFFWDQLLIKNGAYIYTKRLELIAFINSFEYDDLHFSIAYDPSIISKDRLEQYKDAEIASKVTLVGPQRDDFIVFQNSDRKSQGFKTQLSRYGSRGEQRLGVLWLRLAELAYIEKITNERPILLLDDIFSELDHQSRQIVLDVIGKQQTIITSADKDIENDLKTVTTMGWITLKNRQSDTIEKNQHI